MNNVQTKCLTAQEIYDLIHSYPVGYMFWGCNEMCTFYQFDCREVHIRHFSSGVPYLTRVRRGAAGKLQPTFIIKGYQHETKVTEWDDGIDLVFEVNGVNMTMKLKNHVEY